MKELIKKLLREELLTENEVSKSCDCCKYFDENSLTMYSGLEHPIYHVINKQQLYELEYLSPEEYLSNISNGRNDALGNAYNDEKAEKYSLLMKNGSKAPIGYYVKGKFEQEGRHRAAAAMKLNCNIIPVVKITKDLPNKFIHNFVLKLKNLTNEQVNELFINKGYNGISSLDWSELQYYIEYKL